MATLSALCALRVRTNHCSYTGETGKGKSCRAVRVRSTLPSTVRQLFSASSCGFMEKLYFCRQLVAETE